MKLTTRGVVSGDVPTLVTLERPGRQLQKVPRTSSRPANPAKDGRAARRTAKYADWMKGLLTFVPDGRYELKSFGTGAERNSVSAYAVFSGTHTGQGGGACPPTGKSVKTDYVYVMDCDGGKIRHMTKIWHAGLAMKEFGWI